MGRTIKEIKKQMTDMFMADKTIKEKYGYVDNATFEKSLTKVSIENILFYVVSFCIYSLEKLFDIHMRDVSDTINTLKTHTLRWYRDKALRFQLGRELMADSDKYDNTGLTSEDISRLEIVKQAAAVEQENDAGRRILRIKIAGNNNNLEPVNDDILKAVEAYFTQIKDAGVLLQVTSGNPDKLYGKLTVHYNPTVLDSNGLLISGGSEKPVLQAINQYLQNLTFNGEFSIMKMTEVISQVQGVELVHANEIGSKTAAGESTAITDRYNPDSGYMRIVDNKDLIIRYESYI